jgi:hypothetical protein
MLGAVAAALVAVAPASAASTPTIPKGELHAIRALLRTFVPEAMGRVHPGRAWTLATPAMRSGSTRAEWRQGSLPVFPYPVSANGLGIRPITVSPGDVTFDLMVHPRPGSNAGVEVYTTEVQRVGGRWLVASMAASAQFAGSGGPATITAEPDFAPHAQGLPSRNSFYGARVLVPFLVIGLPVIIAPCAFFLIWWRGRAPRADVDVRERATTPWR